MHQASRQDNGNAPALASTGKQEAGWPRRLRTPSYPGTESVTALDPGLNTGLHCADKGMSWQYACRNRQWSLQTGFQCSPAAVSSHGSGAAIALFCLLL